ncbi:hypothetical protein CIY_25690 [Butyrivibrio fibrisolvens 16/4]|nr:hypothetical protein CIY_25690 [Butyrivibrio fibrisolvens 16/4]
MKRVFSLILVAALLLLPITSYATEEAPDVPSPSISGEVVPALEPTPSLPDASIPEIDTSDDVITPELPDTKDTNEATSDESASASESSAEESTPAEEESESNAAENSESTETENSESTEEITDNNEESEDHLHDFLYTSNGDGTHTVTCTSRVHIYDPNDSDSIIDEKDCDYYEVENCTFEKGICIYCGYIEETDFNPDVSITLLNESCNIGFSNPIICLDISQKYYDISYAQVCFANYEKRKFINVGLAQKNILIVTLMNLYTYPMMPGMHHPI